MAKKSGSYRIGVDVGGTNTDAAVIDITATDTPSRGVCASGKTPTTVDVTSGIHTVIENVLAKSEVDRKDVLSVAIGTTHFVNAVVEADARRLSKVAVVRLCGPFTKQVGISLKRLMINMFGEVVVMLTRLDTPIFGLSSCSQGHYGRPGLLSGWR